VDRSALSAETTADALPFIATAPRGFAELLAEELAGLGAHAPRLRGTGVEFSGTLEAGYRACLWSRLASRVYLQLAQFEAPDTEAFYAAVRAIDWRAHVDPARTLACEFSGRHPAITHTHFGALKLKDGVCDQLREATGRRPDIDIERPAVRLHAHARGAHVTVSLDLAGEGLHARGYRQAAGEAPLRENVAAGLLLRAGWANMAAQGAAFLDPLCGSGTLVIEAALMAADRAPALTRTYFGFLGWRAHDTDLWQRLLAEARGRAAATVAAVICGSDSDAGVLELAAANARRAQIATQVNFQRTAVSAARPPGPSGLVATNPPYGVRLGDEAAARAVHRELGATLRAHFGGWQAAILTALPTASRELRLRTFRTHAVWNGAIECRLLRVDLSRPGAADLSARAEAAQAVAAELAQSPGAQMFTNRLEKNQKRLGRRAEREQVSCYRLYDADMPEYAFAIDRYAVGDPSPSAAVGLHLYVQEYAAPASVDVEAARKRRAEALAALPQATGVVRERIHLRLRRRQRGEGQYSRLGESAARYVVEEGGLKFLVNFDQYLDTGLFLDHRLTRARLRAAAHDARFLNLFCYTATATVYAAAGGARSSLSVDLSNTYLDWAAENFGLNGLSPSLHALERADCRAWLPAAAARAQRFELIFLDPPTFSNSARMQGVLDVQRDQAELIDGCMRLLAPAGLLVFSTNAQRFRLDEALKERYALTDVSAATIPFDFERNARIHRCYEIRHR
jgi:23S rRNA (guanine2445-N2)-methyltransferase / 23S rRNA (guanine2069-N7)-methyltransferase